MVAGVRESLNGIVLPEQTAPATPAAGQVSVYAKSDGKVYKKDDTGTETELGGGGGTVPYTETIGNGAATSFVITHDLGTRDVAVVAYKLADPWEDLNVHVERTSTTQVTLVFGVAPATNSVRVLVFSQAMTNEFSPVSVYDWVTDAYVLRNETAAIYVDPEGGHTPPDPDGIHIQSTVETLTYALGDEETAITTGTKLVIHVPYGFELTEVRGELSTAGSTNTVFDVHKGAGAGTTIFSTKITVESSEETSDTAAAPPVLSTTTLARSDRLIFDIDTAGTGAKGPKITLYGYRT